MMKKKKCVPTSNSAGHDLSQPEYSATQSRHKPSNRAGSLESLDDSE